MKLAFYFSLACTAECGHCITFAGPGVKRKMTLAEARAVIEQAAATPQLDGIVFTGGENFIHRRELLELIRLCRVHDLATEIISNASWATSVAKASQMLKPFKAAGLNVLRLSIDQFHLPFIPPKRVHAALEAMRELALVLHVTCVVTHDNIVHKDDRLDDTMAALGFDLASWTTADAERLAGALRTHWPADLLTLVDSYQFRREDLFAIDDVIRLMSMPSAQAHRLADWYVEHKVMLQYQTLATEGRGRELIESVPSKHVDEIPEVVCNSVGYTPTVNPEGDVFPCCSSWVNFARQRIGNVSQESLATLMGRIADDPIAKFMHYQGPRTLVKYLRDKGHDLPDGYSHPCHLCGVALEHFSRPELLAHIEAFYREHPWRLIVTNQGLDPLITAADSFLERAS
ncbi:radical SAM protein [Bradyrhizobium sp. SZCCHNS3051]|uniref:radical SAM protein n=1 Tax=Bradyrhizobium sp. SZCCHNS3051 TaxID=3057320 RepID=UPI002916E03A|nr:radical SAM protein [Bradyrhizobium sp. SZCCHNS3051]